GDHLQREAAGDLAGHVLVVLALDAEDALGVLLRGDQHVAVLHEVAHPAPRLGLAPQLGAVVQVDAGRYAGGAGGPGRPAGRLGGAGAEGGRDAGHVKPARPGEDGLPGDHAGPDAGDGRPLAVVEHAAGPRRGAELQEVNADAVVVGPDDVLGIDAGLAG